MSEKARSVDRNGGADEKGLSQGAPAEERIGKYEIVGLLGKGGMGAVYRAFDPFLERAVALKVMLPQIAEDPEHKRRFEREARAVARLTHPNVVTVFDLGYHTSGAPYIVMELLQGEDLLHILSQGAPLPLAQKVSIVLQVLDGLGQAHEIGIVHRDIKPANVFITSHGTAKIMDFGIARLGSAGATGTGPVLGTAAYMSPEQVNGERVDTRSDLFSVASLLCELLAGRRPFEAETPIATMFQIAHKEPVLALPAGPEYERLIPVLKKALEKDPNDRYATSAEFADALSRCLDGPSLHARPRVEVKGREEKGSAPAAGDIDTTRPFSSALVQGTKPHAQRPDPRELFRSLREVYVKGKSGVLTFISERGSRSLHLYRGRITHASSERPGEHLGDVLVRYGVISQKDLERQLETEKRLGPVLSGQGLLGEKGLEGALALHVRETLFAMLEESEGPHTFEELPETASKAEVASSLSTGQVILEATRRVVDPEMVRLVLGDMDRVLTLSSDPLLRFQPITLTPTDGFVLSRVDGTLSARDVINLSPVPPEDTERSLFGLICTGIVDYEEQKSPTARPSAHRAPAPARPEVMSPRGARMTDSRSTLPSPTAAPSPPLSRADDAAPAGKASAASSEPSGRAQPSPPEPALAAPAESSAPPKSAESAVPLEPGKALPPEPALLSPAEPSAPPRSAEPAVPSEPGKELPPEPTPPSKAVASAAPSGRGKPSPPEPRPTSPPGPAPPGAPARPTDAEAGSAIREAEGLFAQERYEDAIRKVQPLVPLVKGALRTRAAILLARSCMKCGDRNKQAESVLLALVAEDPKCTPAFFFLGSLYQERNELDRARDMYQKILELAPNHRGAASELSTLGEG